MVFTCTLPRVSETNVEFQVAWITAGGKVVFTQMVGADARVAKLDMASVKCAAVKTSVSVGVGFRKNLRKDST